MRRWLEAIKVFLIVQLAALAHFLVRCTWRLHRGPLPPEIARRIKENKPVIFGHLHQDDVSLIAFFKDTKVGVLVSQSKDGTLLAKYFEKIGWVVARGSSSRGAASGFLELLRLCKEERLVWITFAVDGPRGPVGKTKNGIFKLADILDAPVVPVVALARRRWTFSRAWSKTFIPRPFAKVQVKFLNPISAAEIKKMCAERNYSALATRFDDQIAHEKQNYI